MRPRLALVMLAIGAFALAGCHGALGAWKPASTDLLGSWTSVPCDAELALANDGTVTARNLRRDDEPAVSGSGTWRLGTTSASVPGLFVSVGETDVILDPLTKNEQPILLNILGNVGAGKTCEYVKTDIR